VLFGVAAVGGGGVSRKKERICWCVCLCCAAGRLPFVRRLSQVIMLSPCHRPCPDRHFSHLLLVFVGNTFVLASVSLSVCFSLFLCLCLTFTLSLSLSLSLTPFCL
jgi:hypothetical protein